MALASKLERDDDYIQKRLPLAQGQQYLCALAITNGAHPVWADMHESTEQIIAKAGAMLKYALNQTRDELQK